MLILKKISGLMLMLLCISALPCAAAQNCTSCHVAQKSGFSTAHAAIAEQCTQCHAGNAEGTTQAQAHTGLIAFPGNLDTAARACGGCHVEEVAAVTKSLMHTGARLIATTRKTFGEPAHNPGHNTLSELAQSPADSLLRKQCASCHLGQNKTVHQLDATHDRGGGCLACHINQQSKSSHPALTATVSDARCFGCHSRSGRISLSYAGLAEIIPPPEGADQQHPPAQLEDGRTVEILSADRHHAGGMACIDCHTARDVMGLGAASPSTGAHKTIDIRCVDCHQITRSITAEQWPAAYRKLRVQVPFKTDARTRFALSTNGTPLWNIELDSAGGARLHRKDGQGVLPIPPYRAEDHPLAKQHARLDCSSCHANWAPQCYGCHLSYDESEQQYDHMLGKMTPGRWNEQRADTRNALPPLGVDADGKIVVVVPGMIMDVTHPAWEQPLFLRRFAALEPHTTGAARSCASCHRSSIALGLGQGLLRKDGERWQFKPALPPLQDGLPADAWTRLDGAATPPVTDAVRPFSRKEIERILAAPLPPESLTAR
ncbi:hypothetical protein [Sinimarinibacterium sp. CAU 1509]|uniref:hypothetical protein n=1 Tax=Sinimarinibacterium sp. CAU 1509 TaxID=2562283 RepID=UPI001B7FB7B0|nr:hypothetical protein [Sinimarinibacterium sp. CAU 1509]